MSAAFFERSRTIGSDNLDALVEHVVDDLSTGSALKPDQIVFSAVA